MTLRSPKILRRSAYTLVELLVAIAILGAIVVMMVAVSKQASQAWLMGVGQNERRSNGRVLLDFVAHDMKAAMRPTQALTPSTSTASPANLQFFANIATPPSSTTNPTAIPLPYLNPHAVFFQAPVAVNTTYGKVAEIGYFVKWDTVTKPGTYFAQMCRFLVDPDVIDPTTGNTKPSSNYQIYNRTPATGNPVNWLNAGVVTALTPTTAPSYQGWFADNVIAFWVRCLDSAGQPITLNAAGTAFPNYGYDSRQGYTDSTGIIHPGPALPAAVDLAIVTVDSQAARRITSKLGPTVTTPADMLKDKTTSGSVDYFVNNLPRPIKRGAQAFFTRVYIPTK